MYPTKNEFNHPNDRRGEMPINPRKAARLRDISEITHGAIHHTGVWGKTSDQHAYFHTNPEPQGRDWPTVAYTSYIGRDARRELLLDYWTVGYHCKGINTKAIGIVAEGNYDQNELPEEMIKAIVEECLYHEAKLGRRLIWTWHNVIRPGWICPGRFFPKDEILSRIELAYLEPEPEDPDILDPPENEQPSERNPVGCAAIILALKAVLAFSFYLIYYGL